MAVAGIHHSVFDNRPRNASHCAAPRTAPATAPPARAVVRLVTGPSTAMAMRPPRGKPRKVGSQRSQRPFAVRGSKSDLAAGERVDMTYSVSCTCEQSPPRGWPSWRMQVLPARRQGNEGRELHNVCRTLRSVLSGSQEHKGRAQAASADEWCQRAVVLPSFVSYWKSSRLCDAVPIT